PISASRSNTRSETCLVLLLSAKSGISDVGSAGVDTTSDPPVGLLPSWWSAAEPPSPPQPEARAKPMNIQSRDTGIRVTRANRTALVSDRGRKRGIQRISRKSGSNSATGDGVGTTYVQDDVQAPWKGTRRSSMPGPAHILVARTQETRGPVKVQLPVVARLGHIRRRRDPG